MRKINEKQKNKVKIAKRMSKINISTSSWIKMKRIIVKNGLT